MTLPFGEYTKAIELNPDLMSRPITIAVMLATKKGSMTLPLVTYN